MSHKLDLSWLCVCIQDNKKDWLIDWLIDWLYCSLHDNITVTTLAIGSIIYHYLGTLLDPHSSHCSQPFPVGRNSLVHTQLYNLQGYRGCHRSKGTLTHMLYTLYLRNTDLKELCVCVCACVCVTTTNTHELYRRQKLRPLNCVKRMQCSLYTIWKRKTTCLFNTIPLIW